MNKRHHSINFKSDQQFTGIARFTSLFIIVFYSVLAQAGDLQIQTLDVTRLAGDKLQLQLEMNGPVIAPKVFHTDNPARIALDFSGVKSALQKKKYPINLDAADSIYVAESNDRVRVVINLITAVPYQTRIEGNKFFLTLTAAGEVKPPEPSETAAVTNAQRNAREQIVSRLLPEQGIKNIDFKRGPDGEGRILVALAAPNTLVNTREIGGNVELTFVNTRLPERLSKRLDVSEFATPVRFIDAISEHQRSKIVVGLQNNLYEYSLFQSEGLLTVEFRPLTSAEKAVLDSKKDKYTGDRLSLNFQDIDIRSVITLLAEFTGQNVVAGDDVTGAVTLKLDDVPWDEALDFVMMTKGLEKFQTGNVTLVAPVGKIKEYKEKQRETEKVVEQAEPLQTEYLKINYARAENFSRLLYGGNAGFFGNCGIATAGGSQGQGGSRGGQGGSGGGGGGFGQQGGGGFGQQGGGGQGGNDEDRFSLMSSRGTVVVDGRTNTLIVRETAARLTEIKKLIQKLDVPVKQVMIESRIVIANDNFAKELGVRFGVAKADVGGKNRFGVGGGGTQSSIDGTTSINDTLVDLATSSTPFGSFGATLVKAADYVLNLELSALQDEGKGEIISNPRIMTADRCQARIKQGFEIPFQTASANLGTNIEFKEALLELEVTPQITPDGTILMALVINKDEPDFSNAVLGQPALITREIETNVHVKDGETVVLGGVFEGTYNRAVGTVPFFSDLPGIGFLFRRTETQDDKTELLIFITPKIVLNNEIAY